MLSLSRTQNKTDSLSRFHVSQKRKLCNLYHSPKYWAEELYFKKHMLYRSKPI